MDPFLLSALISGAGQIFGGLFQSNAADKATKAQTSGNDKALALQKEIFESNKTTTQPWIDAGKQALDSLVNKTMSGEFDLSGYGMDHLVEDPGYQFRLAEGEKALNRAASARGKFLGGDQLKALTDYNQESASQEFDNAFARKTQERNAEYGRLQDINSAGLTAAGQRAGVASNYAANAGNIIQNTGQAQAQGAINQGNAWSGVATGIPKVANNAIENYMLYDRLAAAGVG